MVTGKWRFPIYEQGQFKAWVDCTQYVLNVFDKSYRLLPQGNYYFNLTIFRIGEIPPPKWHINLTLSRVSLQLS